MSIETTTNQRLAEAGGDGDKMHPIQNAWGGLFPVVLGGKWSNLIEREGEGPGNGLKQPPQ